MRTAPVWGAVRSSAHSRLRPPSRRRGVSRVSEDDVLFGYRLRVFDLRRPDECERGLPGVRDPPLDLLRLEAPGRAARAGDPAAAGAAAAADAATSCRRLSRSGSSRSRSATRALGRGGSRASSRAGALGRDRRLPQRRLALSVPARPQHPRRSGCRWSRATRAPYEPPREPRARAARRGRAARRAGRDRLLLRRPPRAARRAPSGS